MADRDVIRFIQRECLFNAIIDRRFGAPFPLTDNLQIRVGLGKTFQYFWGGIGAFIVNDYVEIIPMDLLLNPAGSL